MTPILLAMPRPDEAPPGGAPGGGGNFMIILLVVMVLMMVLMPLFSKKERHRRKRLEALKKHDKVVTSGGIFGTVVSLDEGTVTLEVAKDVRLRFKRSSVFDLAGTDEPAAPPAEKSKAKT
jgi:preprotein translocase subunit YajC